MIELFKKRKVGVALGSGAARGWAHIGVIRALQEAGIEPVCVAGTSMGALVGAIYAAGKLDELEAFARNLTTRQVLSYMDLSMPLRGLLAGDKIAELLREFLGDMAVDGARLPFCAVATDLATGNEVRLYEGPMVDAVKASIAIPGIFQPVERGGTFLVDGGLVNPVPVDVARDIGASHVVAVDLNHDVVACNWCLPEKETPQVSLDDTKARHALDELASGKGGSSAAIMALLDRRYRDMGVQMKERMMNWIVRSSRPNIFDVIGGSINVVSHIVTRVNLEKTRPEILVQPPLGKMNLWDFTDASRAIDEGYQVTKKALYQTWK